MRKTCPKCDEPYFRKIVASHHYENSGLPDVYLEDVELRECACGESLVLRGMGELLKVIAICLAHKPARLTGEEIRFLRKTLGAKAKDFAEKMSLSPEHLSRIENGAQEVSASTDKLARLRICLDLLRSTDGHRFVHMFDVDDLLKIIDGPLPPDELALWLRYTGEMYLEKPAEFHFSSAA